MAVEVGAVVVVVVAVDVEVDVEDGSGDVEGLDEALTDELEEAEGDPVAVADTLALFVTTAV